MAKFEYATSAVAQTVFSLETTLRLNRPDSPVIDPSIYNLLELTVRWRRIAQIRLRRQIILVFLLSDLIFCLKVDRTSTDNDVFIFLIEMN